MQHIASRLKKKPNPTKGHNPQSLIGFLQQHDGLQNVDLVRFNNAAVHDHFRCTQRVQGNSTMDENATSHVDVLKMKCAFSRLNMMSSSHCTGNTKTGEQKGQANYASGRALTTFSKYLSKVSTKE
jgi:hypothetical protein